MRWRSVLLCSLLLSACPGRGAENSDAEVMQHTKSRWVGMVVQIEGGGSSGNAHHFSPLPMGGSVDGRLCTYPATVRGGGEHTVVGMDVAAAACTKYL